MKLSEYEKEAAISALGLLLFISVMINFAALSECSYAQGELSAIKKAEAK